VCVSPRTWDLANGKVRLKRVNATEASQFACVLYARRLRTIDGIVLYAKMRSRTSPEMWCKYLVPLLAHGSSSTESIRSQVRRNESPRVLFYSAFV
jgi:hypothetical protein